MEEQFAAWWHAKVLRHEQKRYRASVPMFDLSAKGIYVKCACGKRWAL